MLKRLFSDPTKLMNLDEGVLKGLSLTPPRKVDKPTYEIAGPLEPYDERDHAIARFGLKAGSPEYDDYYSRHPETKARDTARQLVRHVLRVSLLVSGITPIAYFTMLSVR